MQSSLFLIDATSKLNGSRFLRLNLLNGLQKRSFNTRP